MTTGEKLPNARGELRRADVAKEAGISLSALQMYENDARVPRDHIKVRLAEIYGKTVQELFYEK